MDGGDGITYIFIHTSKLTMLHLIVLVTSIHTHRKVTTFGWNLCHSYENFEGPTKILSSATKTQKIKSGFSLTAVQRYNCRDC